MQEKTEPIALAGLVLTEHARQRMAQRNLTSSDISYIIKHGKEVHRAGAILITLRKCDISKSARQNTSITHLSGENNHDPKP